MVLNFEYDKNGELKLYLDIHGATQLKSYLEKIIEKKDTHIHLMTPSWGGGELSEELFEENAELINQVLIQLVTSNDV